MRSSDKSPQQTCDGTGPGGGRFVKAIRLRDTTLPNVVGQRIQILYGAGQEVWRARAQNGDGTITDWNWAVGTQGPGFSNRDPVHSDIWDAWIDPSAGGQTAWVAGDGGVYTAIVNKTYDFSSNVRWQPGMTGLHTHQISQISVIRMDQEARSRLLYALGDNSAWFQQGTDLTQPAARWDAYPGLGDGNWTAAEPSARDFAVMARNRQYMGLVRFATNEVQGIQLINARPGSFVDPSLPWRFRFMPAPKTAGAYPTADVVMMVDLPLTDRRGKPFAIQPGPPSNGAPVLIRNRTFDVNPNINDGNAQGAGWSLEIGNLPPGTQGFYVSGSRTAPTYYAFASVNGVLSLHAYRAGQWTQIATQLVSAQDFVAGEPAFVNPYDPSVIYTLGASSVLASRDGGSSFRSDVTLTQLIGGNTSIITRIAFSYDNPGYVAVSTIQGDILFSDSPGKWKNLGGLLPAPSVSVRSLGIDDTGIYAGTFGHGLWRIAQYQVGPEANPGLGWHWADQGAPGMTAVAGSAGTLTYSDGGTQRLYAFVRGANGHLWVNFFDGQNWHWADQGAPGPTTVAAGAGTLTYSDRGIQRLYAFVCGVDGHLWVNFFDGQNWYWADQGAPGTTAVAGGVGTLTYADGGTQRLYAFVRGADGHVWGNFFDGQNWYWADQGAPGTTRAAAGAGTLTYSDRGIQRLYAFVCGADGHLWVNFFDGQNWHWADQGTPGTTAVVEGAGTLTYSDRGTQRLYAFVRGADGHLWVNFFDGQNWYWADQGAAATTVVVEGAGTLTYSDGGTQRLYVFVRGADGHLWVNFFDGQNWHWADQGTPGTTTVAESAGTLTYNDGRTQRLYAFVRGADGHLWVDFS